MNADGSYDPVRFTRESARRIARVVRAAEAAPPAAKPLSFDRVSDTRRQALFRMATFSGEWSINTPKVVTFSNRTNTPNTASVTNELIDLPTSGTRKCAIAKEGTSWYLVNWQWNVVQAATAATLSDTSLTFKTVPVGGLGTGATSAFSVSVATCATSTTG
jgi:hypothetical protein